MLSRGPNIVIPPWVFLVSLCNSFIYIKSDVSVFFVLYSFYVGVKPQCTQTTWFPTWNVNVHLIIRIWSTCLLLERDVCPRRSKPVPRQFSTLLKANWSENIFLCFYGPYLSTFFLDGCRNVLAVKAMGVIQKQLDMCQYTEILGTNYCGQLHTILHSGCAESGWLAW